MRRAGPSVGWGVAGWLWLWSWLGLALAQGGVVRPDVPSEFLDFTRRLQGDSLTICVNAESILAPFEVDLARAIGDALLLSVEIKEVSGHRAPPILDYRFPVNEDELYILLHNDCQMMTGFLLSESRFADWLTLSRPYVELGFVLVTREERVASLADLVPGSRVGTKILSTVDIAFTILNDRRSEGMRWRRIPYPDNRLLIDRLVEGELEAILVWEPGLYAGVGGDLQAAGLRAIDPQPLAPPTQRFGAVFLSREGFLRSAVDQAIHVLIDDGTIARLLEVHGVPGRAPRQN